MTRAEAAALFPVTTDDLRVFRELFGEIKVLYIAGKGHTFGKKPEPVNENP